MAAILWYIFAGSEKLVLSETRAHPSGFTTFNHLVSLFVFTCAGGSIELRRPPRYPYSSFYDWLNFPAYAAVPIGEDGDLFPDVKNWKI